MFDLAEKWNEVFTRELVSIERRSGVPVEHWVVGGRRGKATPDGENADWWRGEGLRQIEAYVDWLDDTGWSIATMPDGRPGIEWDVIAWFGGRPVKAIIDSIFTNGSDLIVVDFKTGRKKQMPLQLGLYASIIEATQSVRPKWGGYYMSREAELSDLHDLSPWSIDFFNYTFNAMNINVDAGLYPPNVSDHCNWCSVRQYCVAMNGPKSSEYPLHKKGK